MRAAFDPRHHGVDLLLRQRTIVGELAVVRIGAPGRHLPLHDRGADRLRPRAHFVVGEERHRSDLAGPMAALTALLEDGRHVLVVRDLDRRRRRSAGGVQRGGLCLGGRRRGRHRRSLRRRVALRSGAEDLLRLLGVDGHFHEAVQHLFPGLVAVVDVGGRIGVPGIAGRVVVVADALEDGALGQELGLREVVVDLPVEVVLRHVEQDLLRAVGVGGPIRERLAAQVHVRQQRHQLEVGLHLGRRHHHRVGRAGGDGEVGVVDQHAAHALDRRLLREHEPDAGLVARLGPDRRVVELHQDVGAGLDEARLTGLERRCVAARHEHVERLAGAAGGELRRLVGAGTVGAALEVEEPALRRGRVVRCDRSDHVVDDAAIPRPHLDPLDPLVLGEAGGEDDVLVGDGAGCRHLELDRHLEDDVGRTDAPAVAPLDRRRRVLGVTLRPAALRPSHQRVDLGWRQGAVVGEAPVRRIGEPRRHQLLLHGGADGLGPRPRLLVGQERHRPDLAGPVAALAVPLEDRLDVAVEGERRGRSGHRDRRSRDRQPGGCEQRAFHAVLRNLTSSRLRAAPPGRAAVGWTFPWRV